MHQAIFDHHVIGVVSTNCYVFGDPKEAIMFDPGGEEAIDIVEDLVNNGIEVKHVIATHGHFDHLGWATEVQKAVEGAKVYLHTGEKPVYEKFIDVMPRYGLAKVELREPDMWLNDQQMLDLGGYKIRVLHTPGHSPGSASFMLESIPSDAEDYIPLQPSRTAFVGDTLFAGSIGRVDLPYADPNQMVRSLHLLMRELKPEVLLYPGHGLTSEMGREMESNPFLRALQQGRQIF